MGREGKERLASDNFRVQVLCKTLHKRGIVNIFSSSAFVNLESGCRYIRSLGNKVSALWSKAMAAVFAPLRKITARELDVLHPDPRNPKYSIYSLADTLECGHVQSVYLFGGLQDLVNAYTDSPAIRAKRHRCRPCASLLAKKKPQSVPLPAVAKTA